MENISQTSVDMDVVPLSTIVPFWEHIFVAIIIIIIAIAGLIGNSMIIIAVALSRKLQTSTNVFVTSLAATDLLTSFFWIWFALSILGQNGWIIPQAFWLCQLTAFVLIASTGTSLYTLGAIAINRLLLIVKPKVHKKVFTHKKMYLYVISLWVVPVVILATFLITDTGAVGYDISRSSCSDLDDHEKSKIFNVSQILAGFPLSFSAIMISYIWIYIHLKKHFNNQVNPESQSTSGADTSNRNPNTQQNLMAERAEVFTVRPSDERRKRISRQQVEITKNLFWVICAFFACFLPFYITVSQPHNPLILHLGFYTQLGPEMNSAINFVIYASKHPDFKVVFGHMVRRSYADIPQPSKFLKYLMSKDR